MARDFISIKLLQETKKKRRKRTLKPSQISPRKDRYHIAMVYFPTWWPVQFTDSRTPQGGSWHSKKPPRKQQINSPEDKSKLTSTTYCFASTNKPPLQVGSQQLEKQERGDCRHGSLLCLHWQMRQKGGPRGVRGEEEPRWDSHVSGLSKCHQEFLPNPVPQGEFTFPRDRRC